jgi:hypothetical protein
VPFDDEAESILSINLWQMGWFRVLPLTVCDKTTPHIEIPTFVYGEKHRKINLNGAKCRHRRATKISCT